MMEHVQTIISDIRLEWGRGTIGRIKHRANIFVFPLRKKLPMFSDFDSLVWIFKSSVLKVFRPLWNEKLGRDDHRLNNEFTIPFSIRQSQNKTTKLCIIIVQVLGSLNISKYNTEVKIISCSIFFLFSVQNFLFSCNNCKRVLKGKFHVIVLFVSMIMSALNSPIKSPNMALTFSWRVHTTL